MRRDDFHFELPDRLIAQRPTDARDGSLLMDVRGDGTSSIKPFPSIVEQFNGDEVLVLNDTRVIPARVQGRKSTGGAVEFFFLESLGGGLTLAMLRGKKLRRGTELLFDGAQAVVDDTVGDGTYRVRFSADFDVHEWLETTGSMPLPPYIRRPADSRDEARYQTVFAQRPGAVAAPTAGLHLTEPLLEALKAKGVLIKMVTLHVGLGTFSPMRVDHIAEHTMHTERFVVPNDTAEAVTSGRPVVAVGTTVVRALESHALNPDSQATDIFIYPGFKFQRVDGLLTNFHLPESTLLMMVSAFAGERVIKEAYATAIAAELRFFSYGDAMLLRREGGTWT